MAMLEDEPAPKAPPEPRGRSARSVRTSEAQILATLCLKQYKTQIKTIHMPFQWLSPPALLDQCALSGSTASVALYHSLSPSSA